MVTPVEPEGMRHRSRRPPGQTALGSPILRLFSQIGDCLGKACGYHRAHMFFGFCRRWAVVAALSAGVGEAQVPEPLFPSVRASVSINEDLESPVVSWQGISGARYAIEYSRNLRDWFFLETTESFSDGPTSTLDFFRDISRPAFYRVLRTDLPLAAPLTFPAPDDPLVSSLPELLLGVGGNVFTAPFYEQTVVDPTGQAKYYEMLFDGPFRIERRVFPDAGSFSDDISQELGQLHTQQDNVYVTIIGYNWRRQAVTWSPRQLLFTHFDEGQFPYVPNDRFEPLVNNTIGYRMSGKATEGTFETRYGQTDRVTGSKILDLLFWSEDREKVTVLRLLLPQGLTPGSYAWTTSSAYNANPAGACTFGTAAPDYIVQAIDGPELQDWSYQSQKANPAGTTTIQKLAVQHPTLDVYRIDISGQSNIPGETFSGYAWVLVSKF